MTDPAGLAALLALSDARDACRVLDARQVAAAAGLTPSTSGRGCCQAWLPGAWP